MSRPSPRDVFENPEQHWAFLTTEEDANFEGQFFDRKQASRTKKNGSVDVSDTKTHIAETVSAFANTNREGSLLVIGISTEGQVEGFRELSENQRIELTQGFEQKLRNQVTETKLHTCQTSAGDEDEICLIYVHFTADAICETTDKDSKAWKRSGYHNNLMDDRQKEQMRRDKRVVVDEQRLICEYYPDEIDEDVLSVFREEHLAHSTQEYSDEELLDNAGALRVDQSRKFFTKAGLLFFSKSPRRYLSWACIRIKQFTVSVEDKDNRGLPVLDKYFDGPIRRQLSDVRKFLQTLQDYPFLAIDEAIVNALVHRDYGINIPIEIELYSNAFVVKNPGEVIQNDKTLPSQFNLQDVRLSHMPRNSFLVRWLQTTRDVKALGEGTVTIREETAKYGLPTPRYYSNYGETVFVLHNVTENQANSLQTTDGTAIGYSVVSADRTALNYENLYCCPYDPEDVDDAVLETFTEAYVREQQKVFDTKESLLLDSGAIIKDETGYAFTNAGFLFFTSNPQRLIPWGYIRLLRFETDVENIDNRGLPSLAEKKFSGPLVKQILSVRAFFRETLFFRTFTKRKPDGGFSEEPEYPYIAIDEAIVNAIVHRDYSVTIPIECEAYRNAFVVNNAGAIQQRNEIVPESFSLDQLKLEHMPRNPKILEWLKLLGDVRALSEGTRRMLEEMTESSLPAPRYLQRNNETRLLLYNNIGLRTTSQNSQGKSPEFSNLFKLDFYDDDGGPPKKDAMEFRFRDFMSRLNDALKANNWFVDRLSYGRLTAHVQGDHIHLPASVMSFVRFYEAYRFQITKLNDAYYLCIDFKLEIKNILTLSRLLDFLAKDDLVQKWGIARWNGEWQRSRIISIGDTTCWVYLVDYDENAEVDITSVIPNLPNGMVEKILRKNSISFDIYRAKKKHSLGATPNASRLVAEKIVEVAQQLKSRIFPLVFNGMQILLNSNPQRLSRQGKPSSVFFANTIPEPVVEFGRKQETSDIRSGITSFGAYDDEQQIVEIVPICMHDSVDGMKNLIYRLKTGAYRYKGSERTFSTRLNFQEVHAVQSPEAALEKCRELLSDNPDWIGNEKLNRIFLVHTPEANYASDDETSPYYRVKRYLFENGIPCQMVDTPTLRNPDWKDLNLTLNIAAKCGVTPWVLPNAIPDADFFIGLSYTQNRSRNDDRLMGYANVFTDFGRWLFYSGNSNAFRYEDRGKHYKQLVEQTFEKLTLSPTPSIYFHYSAKFSRDDINIILNAARRIRPQGTYSFVSLNNSHIIRLFDERVDTDGSFARGSYMVASNNRIYLSTTGYNPYRKTLGTPQMLEATIRVYSPDPDQKPKPDLRSLAVQLLNLTKLNWSSSDSISGEPITTQYAGKIAYLTSAFLRQKSEFRLHPVLEKTPWFL